MGTGVFYENDNEFKLVWLDGGGLVMADGNSFLNVTIDFDRSHLFFPHLIHWFLLILAVMIAVSYGPKLIKEVREGKRKLWPDKGAVDWLRLLGTLALTILYFVLMDYFGMLFPNEGLGFLLMSVPFMFLLSLLYVHGPGRRQLVIIALSSIISPTVAWYVLARMFNITLP